MSNPRLKQLKLKAGIVRRCTKDVTSYEKEAEKEQLKVEKYKAEGKDDHDIKKQEEILAETLMMIPDSKRRLKKCWEELNTILESEKDLEETNEYQEARNVWLEAKKQFECEADH